MKKLLCVGMVLGLAGIASAGQGFEGDVDTSWDTVGNWSQGYVVDDSTTDPATFTPQWANAVDFRNNAVMDIGAGEVRQAYAFAMGVYGADNTELNMNGGSLTIGNWGMDIGRGDTHNSNHDGDATINMTDGEINTPWLLVGNDFNPDAAGATVSAIEGTINMSGGVINVGNHLRVGMNESTGVMNLSGDAVINLSQLQMNTQGGGWGTPDDHYDALITIEDGAVLNINGGHENAEDLAAEIAIYQGYEDSGWLTSSAGGVDIAYIEATDTIEISAIPEPATIGLLGLSALALFIRKRFLT